MNNIDKALIINEKILEHIQFEFKNTFNLRIFINLKNIFIIILYYILIYF